MPSDVPPPNRRLRRAAPANENLAGSLAEGLQQIHAEAGGVFEVYLVGQCDAPALLLDAAAGSEVADALLRWAADVTKKTGAPAGRRPRCLCCPGELITMRGARVGIAVPAKSDPGVAMAFTICAACAVATDVNDRVMHGLQGIWPDARRVRVTHADGGRA